MPHTIEKTVRKLTAVGIGGNAALVVFKLVAGLLGNSMAMITDAIHSMSDILATFIAYIGSKIARREADSTHPYGHERFECLAALVLAVILALAGAGIGYAGISALISGSWKNTQPSTIALAGAIVSIVVKEAMYHYTMHHAKAIDSEAFRADAWHHRSDALSSIGALIGIVAAILGYAWADAAASILICLFIFKVAWDVAKGAVDNMLDSPTTAEEENAISNCIAKCNGVIRLDLIKTRRFGNKIYVEAEIALDKTLSLEEAHDICTEVHDTVESSFPGVKHIMIHPNPA